MELQTPVQYIKGIGPKRAEDLSSRSIFTVEDLLYYLPYRYEDRSRFKQVKELQPGERTSILVEVLTSGLVITRKSRLRIFDLAARDSSGLVRCKWFHSEYLDKKKIFHPGQKVIFYGKFEVDPYGTGNLQVINPEFEILDGKASRTVLWKWAESFRSTKPSKVAARACSAASCTTCYRTFLPSPRRCRKKWCFG
jgi:ATP-dependent DNA helicase RecG